MRRLALILAACGLALAGGVYAQDEPPVGRLEGTLLKARTTGTVTLAYRESSIPFSYLSQIKEPIGYSIELCKRVVEAMTESVGRELVIRWLAVNPETRIDAITSGKADLECGSTTNDVERRKRVAFSPIIFISGTKLLVKRGSPIKSFRDLGGKTVVVTAGTTNEKVMQEIARRFKVDFTLVAAPDHAESFARVGQGKADAFATDDVLLHGFIAMNRARNDYSVVGDFLSYDPYGIMFRKDDPQMERLVMQTFRGLADDGEIERQYKRWFMRRLPTGASIDLPMSPQLEAILRAMATKPE